MTCRVTMPPDLSCVVQLLPEHIGSNQGQAGFSNAKSPRTIVIMIFTNDSAVLDRRASVDNAAADPTALADRDIRQEDRVCNAAVGVRGASREQQ